MHWSRMGRDYRGNVVESFVPDDGVAITRVYYPCDRRTVSHDFGAKDGCTFEVVEPAAHTIATLRRTSDGYDAQVVPGGRWYAMSRKYVEDHFASVGEDAWLAALVEDDSKNAPFVDVPKGAKRRRGKSEPVKKPYCVLGGLAMAIQHAGDAKGAELVSADCEESLTAKCRLKFASSRASTYGYQAEKVHAIAHECEANHPTLLQVSRTHVVTVLRGLLFDSAQPEPLPLTRANLDTCIGGPYSGDVVRGYRFVPLPKAVKRSMPMVGGDAKRGRDL